MITGVKVYSRQWMDRFRKGDFIDFPFRIWSLISIYTDEPGFIRDGDREKLKVYGCRDVLSLMFWDITDKEMKNSEFMKKFPDAISFNHGMAKVVINFINEVNSHEDGVLVVHCDAGISRSGAIGTFAVDYLGLDYFAFKEDNPNIMPNPYVFSILKDLSGMNNFFKEGLDMSGWVSARYWETK